jgi:hypothetical protein
MICVLACCVCTSQMVHVVSMHAVPSRLGSSLFQSNDVSGAQYSLFLFCHQEEKGEGAREGVGQEQELDAPFQQHNAQVSTHQGIRS